MLIDSCVLVVWPVKMTPGSCPPARTYSVYAGRTKGVRTPHVMLLNCFCRYCLWRGGLLVRFGSNRMSGRWYRVSFDGYHLTYAVVLPTGRRGLVVVGGLSTCFGQIRRREGFPGSFASCR